MEENKITKYRDEELITKTRALEIWDKNIVNKIEIGTFNGLCEIHYYLFQDIFDFAGKTREVNLSKGNFRFAPAMFLKDNLRIIDKMPINTYDEIIDKYVEMNVAHPFREGNGRSTRIWLDLILRKELGRCVDWSLIDKNDYLQAMERSPINSLEINVLLQKVLTEKINDRQVYMEGIQASYYYEEMESIDINKIEKSKLDEYFNEVEPQSKFIPGNKEQIKIANEPSKTKDDIDK